MWTTFAAVTGGAAGGLTRLTFLVFAVRFDVTAGSDEYRSRAAQTLSLFLTVTVVAVLLSVPRHSRALGGEMVCAALVSGAVLWSLDSTARRVQTSGPSATPILALSAFIAAAGLPLLTGLEWGRYLYVVSALVGLVAGVYGTWLFLTQAGTARARESRDT